MAGDEAVNELTSNLTDALARKGFAGRPRTGPGGERYFAVSVAAFTETVGYLKTRHDISLIGIWAAEEFEGGGITLFYCFEQQERHQLFILEIRLAGEQGISVSADYPIAGYFQREITDGFGVTFSGPADRRRLMLHEVYPDDFHPLRKSFVNGPVETTVVTEKREYRFREFRGEGLYQVAVGPVHAGIIEPGHFRFSVIGETIVNLELRHHWKHRGLEKAAEGRTPEAATALAEAVSGDESAANACGFAMAVEKIGKTEVPGRAEVLRLVVLELERVYSHLGDMAGMVTDVAYPVGAAPFYIMREEVLRWNQKLTGSRFLKGFILPGGVTRDIDAGLLAGLAGFLKTLHRELDRSVACIFESSWVVDRMETTGVVQPKLIPALNLTGPVARASGGTADTRRDHPYGLYSDLKPEVITGHDGDVAARFQVKAKEAAESMRLISAVVAGADPGPVYRKCETPDGYAVALVESARGQNLHWVYLRQGRISRWKARTASFCNWPAIEHAVIGNILPDFPLINKSMNLSYSGNDI